VDIAEKFSSHDCDCPGPSDISGGT